VAALIQEKSQMALTMIVRETGRVPSLATILVGVDPSAGAYRRSIVRTLGKMAIRHVPVDLPTTLTAEEFSATLRRLNEDPDITGVLVLMPLPAHLPAELVLDHLAPLKDVDGITPTNAGRLHLGMPAIKPSTPEGGIELLDHYGIDLTGRHVVVIGRSNVVGRPLATMLTLRDATVTLCHRQTRDLGRLTRQADIVAVAAGCPGLLTHGMVRQGAVVLDFGVNVVDGSLVGDVDIPKIGHLLAAYSPVPGGAGPVTAMVLARNVIVAAYAALGERIGPPLELPAAGFGPPADSGIGD